MPAFRRQSAQRRRTLWRQRTARTAKPCGPGRRCYGQALANAAVAPTGAVPATFAGVREARRNSAPGRARHKPSDHRAGKAVCWASPVCCCAVLPARAFRAADRGCRRHPAFPAPSWLERVSDEAKLGRIQPRERKGVSASRNAHCRAAMPPLNFVLASGETQRVSAEGYSSIPLAARWTCLLQSGSMGQCAFRRASIPRIPGLRQEMRDPAPPLA